MLRSIVVTLVASVRSPEGIPEVLPHSGARVKMPDCARLRADGSNAVAGVTPDVVLPLLGRDSPYQRADKVVRGLTGAWAKIVGTGAKGRHGS